MQMQKVNKIVAALIFIFTSIIYLMTVAPTLSLWDCGEFIACSFRLAVPHPPGSPLFLLVGRIMTLLPIGHDIAFRVNLISVFSSSITVALLYLIIVHLIREWKGDLKDKSDWLMAIFSGVIGSLTFAFTHSFWFNSAEAEVYAASMLFTSLIVWLILVWATKSEEPGNERYLLMIAYLIGLAIAVHLLNVLALPFVTMIYYYKKYEVNVKSFIIMTLVTMVIMLAVYPGMVKYVPIMALKFGAIGLAVFFIAVFWGASWAINNKKSVYTLIFSSILLISIGYSSYATIYIRSNLNPNIDENNPETLKNFVSYIEREQYGDHSITDRRGVWKSSENARKYTSTWDFFWRYQVKKMYVRYFEWQFVGMSDDETNVNPRQFWALPFLLGLIGIYWHYRRDPRRALAVTALFFMTGLAIILYLNQPDPQPRERDYSYVGSFFAYSIWVGLGFMGIMEFLKDYIFKSTEKLKPAVIYTVFAVLLLAVPIQMLAKNFHSHNRSGNYVAWDYSYNILQSCEPNAVLFTNGDNDTFPLWYLQEVEGIRTDVRIVNLSLLNTDWYIYQLRDLPPKVPMRMSDGEIDHVGVRPWKEQIVSINVPKSVALQSQKEYANQFASRTLTLPDKIEFKVKPTIRSRYGNFLRTQDYMILNIIASNHWKRPIYFAVTVPSSNMVGDLRRFLRMDGLVLKLVPYRNWMISPTNLERNLTQVYKYRGLNDPDVYLFGYIKSMLQNYRSAFIQLAQYYAQTNQYAKIKSLFKFMDEKIDPRTVPWGSPQRQMIEQAFYVLADSAYADTLLNDDKSVQDLPILGEHLLRLNKPKLASRLLEKAYELNPSQPRILGLLLNAYQMSGNYSKAIEALQEWMQLHPNDKNARRILQSFEKETARKN